MGGALGAGLGLLLGGALGYERNKRQNEWMQEQRDAKMYADLFKAHPEVFENLPAGMQKDAARLFGPNAIQLFQMGAKASKQQEAAGQQMFEGGTTPAPAQQQTPSSQMIAPPAAAPAAPTGLPEGMTREKFQTLSPSEQIAYIRRASAAGPTAAMRGVDGAGAAPPVAPTAAAPAAAPAPSGPSRGLIHDAETLPLDQVPGHISAAKQFLADHKYLTPERRAQYDDDVKRSEEIYEKRMEKARELAAAGPKKTAEEIAAEPFKKATEARELQRKKDEEARALQRQKDKEARDKQAKIEDEQRKVQQQKAAEQRREQEQKRMVDYRMAAKKKEPIYTDIHNAYFDKNLNRLPPETPIGQAAKTGIVVNKKDIQTVQAAREVNESLNRAGALVPKLLVHDSVGLLGVTARHAHLTERYYAADPDVRELTALKTTHIIPFIRSMSNRLNAQEIALAVDSIPGPSDSIESANRKIEILKRFVKLSLDTLGADVDMGVLGTPAPAPGSPPAGAGAEEY